jgi:apolipoprotein N-acyltransferase
MVSVEKASPWVIMFTAAGMLGAAVLMSGFFDGRVPGFVTAAIGLLGISLSGAVWTEHSGNGGTRRRIAWSVIYAIIVMEYVRSVSFALWLPAALYLAGFYAAAALVIHFLHPQAGILGVAVFSLVGFFRIDILAGPGREIIERNSAFIPAAAGLAFPFGDPVYALAPIPVFYRAAHVFGTSIIVLAYAAAGMFAARAIRERKPVFAITAAGIIGMICVIGIILLPGASGPEVPVLICQGNVASVNTPVRTSAVMPGEDPLISHYRRLTEDGLRANPDTTLVVWPESSWPGLVDSGKAPEYSEWLDGKTLIAAGCSYRLTNGTPTAGNAALVLGPETFSLRDKAVLTPFGEYIPWRLVSLIRPRRTNAWDGNLTPGEWPRHTVEVTGVKFGTLVCWEDSFPGRLAVEVNNGAQALVVVTNDGWFTGTSEPWQHAAALRVRAVEAGLPAIRAGNIAPSFITDASGRITAQFRDKAGYVSGRLLPRTDTPLRFFGIGGWLIAAVLAAMMVWSGVRK